MTKWMLLMMLLGNDPITNELKTQQINSGFSFLSKEQCLFTAYKVREILLKEPFNTKLKNATYKIVCKEVSELINEPET